ncbi:MAG: HAMP domain-containing protein [Burkholderiales bacterium]|nr:HAMP domain-containing protein [Burkholderiales bacterium]
MHSLRQKIIFGYYAVGTLIVGLSLFAFVELYLIEEKILAGGRISEFFDVTLEIRRFEKNYFLYRQVADLTETQRYVHQAQALLRENAEVFEAIATATRMAVLRDQLTQYAALMGEYATLGDAGTARTEALEIRIRQAGKEMVTVAEGIARAERATLQSSLDRHRRVLLISIVVLVMVVVVIGQLLSRRVARPLKSLEDDMEAVANGKLTQLDRVSDDREIVSLTHAFNHVLRELELRQTHLVRAEKLAALGTLLSGVAHELNNPLSNISSSCQILMEEGDEADPTFRRELLGQIDEQTIRARNIVRSLLDFARDREFKTAPLQLAQLVKETLRFLKGQVPTQVTLTTDIPSDLVLQGDKQRLQQVFLNLIKNAAEALESAGKGAGEIRISAHRGRVTGDSAPPGAGEHFFAFGRCEGHGEVVDIEIRDNGSGIPLDILPRIFDPFFTTREVGKGSGLGLFIVFEIIEEHGGCIAVESVPGQGTAFFIRLPLPSGESVEHHG